MQNQGCQGCQIYKNDKTWCLTNHPKIEQNRGISKFTPKIEREKKGKIFIQLKMFMSFHINC